MWQIRSNFQVILFFVDVGAIGAFSICAILILTVASAVYRRCPLSVFSYLYGAVYLTLLRLRPRFSSEYAALNPKSSTSNRLRQDMEHIKRCWLLHAVVTASFALTPPVVLSEKPPRTENAELMRWHFDVAWRTRERERFYY